MEKYVSGYACKGNQPTGSVVDLFKDFANSCSDESTSTTPKSMCTKLLMNTVKRDIPAVEASYELSRLPLYRSSHTFQNISLSGSRVLPTDGSKITITKTPLWIGTFREMIRISRRFLISFVRTEKSQS